MHGSYQSQSQILNHREVVESMNNVSPNGEQFIFNLWETYFSWLYYVASTKENTKHIVAFATKTPTT